MSRNGSGTYTLPAGNPVVTGTTIEASWANTTLSDIATTLTDSLSRSGQGGMTAALRIADGTQAAPGLGFANETGSGFYRASTAEVWAVIQGAQTMNLDSTGVTVPAAKATSIEGTFVFNETGADKDARFEGDTDVNLLFLDASTDRIGIGTNTPASKFVVSNASAEGFEFDPATTILQTYNRSTSAYTNMNLYASQLRLYTGSSPALNATLDSSGNLGLGVTPSAWGVSGEKGLQVSSASVASIPGSSADFGFNYYRDTGGTYKYFGNGGNATAQLMRLTGAGEFQWFTAASGAAGNTITFTQAMTLDASGNLMVGKTTTSAGSAFVKAIDVQGSLSGAIYASATDGGTVTGLFAGDAFADVVYVGSTTNHPTVFLTNNTERARIDSSGALGINDTSPTTRGRFVVRSTDARYFAVSTAGQPTFRYDDNSVTDSLLVNSGITAANQGIGIQAQLGDSGANTATAGYIRFLTDGTWSSTSASRDAYMSFGTTLDGTVAERARITSGGAWQVNTSGIYTQHAIVQRAVNEDTLLLVSPRTTGSQNYGLYVQYSAADPNGTGNSFFTAEGNGTIRAQIRSNGGLANYSANDVNLSDRREKTNFAPAKNYLDTICAIPVQTFNYIDQSADDPGTTLGVVAQDVQAVAPELVMESNWGTNDDPKMRLSIYQTDLQYAMMKCIQELKAQNDELRARVAALEAQP